MAGIDITVDEALLPGLLSGDGTGVAQLMQSVLNQILSAQADDVAGAARYERSEGRQAYRSGTRVRTLYTRVGPLTLQVPQLRDGSFSSEIFKRYQRSEQAFVLAMLEMVVRVYNEELNVELQYVLQCCAEGHIFQILNRMTTLDLIAVLSGKASSETLAEPLL